VSVCETFVTFCVSDGKQSIHLYHQRSLNTVG